MENKDVSAKRSSKKRFIFWLIVFIIFVTVAAACLGVWVYHLVLRKAMSDLYEEARILLPEAYEYEEQIANGNQHNSADFPAGNESQNPEEQAQAKPLVKINFEILKQTSVDVYSWIEIPGTAIALPIVQHPENNGYYLRRAISGAYDITGCIYTQNYNSKDFSDKNTLIYGHYMDDGTKFGPLLSYMDQEFFNSHRRIDIYTENEWLTYEVFAALPFDTRHVLRAYKASDDPYADFLKDVYSSKDARTIIAKDTRVDPETDKIITLSTCLKTGSRRFLVLAKLVKSQLCE